MTAMIPGGAQAKAATMIEALPWLERFHGETVLIRLGGHVMSREALRVAFAEDVVFLHYAGLRPVVIHDGGPQASAQPGRPVAPGAVRAGLPGGSPEAVNEMRVMLTGQVNRDLVSLVNRHGQFAAGLSGEHALLTVSQAQVMAGGEQADPGRAGQTEPPGPGAVAALLDDGRIPVISSVARGPAGQICSVNADTAAAVLAVALGAAKLVLLTDVPGLYAGPEHEPGPDGGTGLNHGPPGQVISQLSASDLAAMLPGLTEGTTPTMESCLTAVTGGVPQAHVLDGRLPHALLLEIFTDTGVGTMVVPDQPAAPRAAS